MGKLEGKVAIVTGGGQGIGRGIALAYAKEGAKVVIGEFNPSTCEEVAKEIRQLGYECHGVVCDVGDNGQVKKMVEEAVKKFGTVDILVNNAMGGTHFKVIEELEDIDWDSSYQSGLKGTFYCCKAVFPYMKDKGGKIINMSSSMGIMGLQRAAVGGAIKEGIRGFTRVAAREWGRYKINLNCICPSAMTPAWKEHSAELSPEILAQYLAANPLGRVGDPEDDIGRLAVFLASKDADYLTGQTICADGGGTML